MPAPAATGRSQGQGTAHQERADSTALSPNSVQKRQILAYEAELAGSSFVGEVCIAALSAVSDFVSHTGSTHR